MFGVVPTDVDSPIVAVELSALLGLTPGQSAGSGAVPQRPQDGARLARSSPPLAASTRLWRDRCMISAMSGTFSALVLARRHALSPDR